jgi:cytoskeletal protein RodZ
VSPRCTRKRLFHRVGTSGYSSTSSTGSRTKSERHGCYSKNREASSSRTKERWARPIAIFMVLLVIGVTALLSLRATVFFDASTAIHVTEQEVSSSSRVSSMSELPKTGGP